jgi:hypothetical protein
LTCGQYKKIKNYLPRKRCDFGAATFDYDQELTILNGCATLWLCVSGGEANA